MTRRCMNQHCSRFAISPSATAATRQTPPCATYRFTCEPGEALGIVGESGSGKSSIAGAILDFLDPAAQIDGRDPVRGPRPRCVFAQAQRRAVLGRRIGAVFQDPFTALNPALRIGRQIAEPIVQHLGAETGRGAAARRGRCCTRWASSAPPTSPRPFPISSAAAMKQRALIAAALACEPPLLILDEPTTALDVTVEAQILRLLARLRATEARQPAVHQPQSRGRAAALRPTSP